MRRRSSALGVQSIWLDESHIQFRRSYKARKLRNFRFSCATPRLVAKIRAVMPYVHTRLHPSSTHTHSLSHSCSLPLSLSLSLSCEVLKSFSVFSREEKEREREREREREKGRDVEKWNRLPIEYVKRDFWLCRWVMARDGGFYSKPWLSKKEFL